MRVFYLNVSIDNRQNGKLQIVRAILYQNAAFYVSIIVRALHCKNSELVARSLQVHIFGADDGNRLRLDAFRRGLGDSLTFRGKHYILICILICVYICVNRNGILSGYFNISCHCCYSVIDRNRTVRAR